jgi:hypothetical protein
MYINKRVHYLPGNYRYQKEHLPQELCPGEPEIVNDMNILLTLKKYINPY